jgi:magnesium and cobalt transporter
MPRKIFARWWAHRKALEVERTSELPSHPLDAAALPTEQAMLANIGRLKDLEASDIMSPRADIIALDLALSRDEILAQIHEHDHARFPVYFDDLDDVRGFIDIKYLFDQVTKNQPFDLAAVMHKPLFIVPSMRVIEILVHMRLSHIHLALVVDEYGGIDGLVTIEDVMETIVGSLQEASDSTDGPRIIVQADGRYLVDARVELPMLEQKLGLTLDLTDDERDDIDTVGGYIFYELGRVPARGEVVKVKSGLEFEILDADPRRIKWLRVLQHGAAGTALPPQKNAVSNPPV